MPEVAERKKLNLCLHCGSSRVDRQTVEQAVTPEPTETWHPIPHSEILNRVEAELTEQKLRIVDEAHGISKDGLRYFGLLQIENGHKNEDYSWILGLRNSHDKTIPAGLVVGSEVFVCDNLAFSGEIKIARRHTPKILEDLPILINSAITQLIGKWKSQDERIEKYKTVNLEQIAVHDLIIRAVDEHALVTSKIPKVLEQWREPKYEDFKPRTVWSLFNSFTTVMKGSNIYTLQRRTEALHKLFDGYVGLN